MPSTVKPLPWRGRAGSGRLSVARVMGGAQQVRDGEAERCFRESDSAAVTSLERPQAADVGERARQRDAPLAGPQNRRDHPAGRGRRMRPSLLDRAFHNGTRSVRETCLQRFGFTDREFSEVGGVAADRLQHGPEPGPGQERGGRVLHRREMGNEPRGGRVIERARPSRHRCEGTRHHASEGWPCEA